MSHISSSDASRLVRTGRIGTLIAFALACLGSIASTVAVASDLYATDANSLYTINQTTGAATLVGPTGVSSMQELASDTRPGSFRLFTSVGAGIGPSSLYTLNPGTGQASLVGTFNLPASSWMNTLAFDSVLGTLYGTDEFSRLYSINTSTAAVSLIGTVTPSFGSIQGLGSDVLGRLFGLTFTGNVVEINKANAQVINGATHATAGLADLAGAPDGLPGLLITASNFNDFFYGIDGTTGAVFPIAPYGGIDFGGLAFGPIPEPGSKGLAIAAGALLHIRRRR